jgi:hypothetical protein
MPTIEKAMMKGRMMKVRKAQIETRDSHKYKNLEFYLNNL